MKTDIHKKKLRIFTGNKSNKNHLEKLETLEMEIKTQQSEALAKLDKISRQIKIGK